MNNKKVLDSNMKYKPGLIDGQNKKYDKIYQQLEVLLEDKDYWVADTGYALFLKKMMNKIIEGKRITSKIDDALVKAVKSYQSFLHLFYKKYLFLQVLQSLMMRIVPKNHFDS